jgi:acyl carrier protein
MDTFTRVRDTLTREFTYPPEEIRPETSLAEIADYDSLAVLEAFAALEEEFGVPFGEETDWIVTVQDAVDFLDGKRLYPRLLRPAAAPPDADLLLRPAQGVGKADPDKLLHPADPEHP